MTFVHVGKETESPFESNLRWPRTQDSCAAMLVKHEHQFLYIKYTGNYIRYWYWLSVSAFCLDIGYRYIFA